MNDEFVNDVLRDMLAYLDNGQAEQLRRVLKHNLSGYEIRQRADSTAEDASAENTRLTDAFLSAKRIEGCSEKSLSYYRKTIETMSEKIGKGITHITTNDLRSYLTGYQTERKSSKVTIDNIRRILSSFFSWLEDEDYILKSPVRRIHKVKTAVTIKETYTDEALETMRDHCDSLRDLALIDMLASTGMRVGELVLLNRDDINFEERECVVFGKGSKERMVYFDARTKIHLQNYLAQGCSEKSLSYYRKTIETMSEKIGKGITHITTNDLRSYLTGYQTERKSSKVTIDNIRRILSSFFSWLEDEDYILKSPVRRIHKVKTAVTIKETYTDEALETMRDHCDSLRDLALIDMLASTGMRVGELVLLNRDDINFEERECVVFGKGSKERMVYFDARTKIHLQNYLAQRTDSNNALFVSLKAPYERLQIGGVESRLRELGKRLSLPRVHPHKFRRTLATMAIDKGMPVEQLQRLLGHQRIDTTLQYAMVKQSNVKIAHRKYIG